MTYRVRIADSALGRIHAQARYIAIEQQAPEIAASWLQRVLKAGDTLSEMPHRCPRGLEDVLFTYDIRAMLVGHFVLLFTIVEESETVWIINARHGRQLPRPDELPIDPGSLADEAEGS